MNIFNVMYYLYDYREVPPPQEITFCCCCCGGDGGDAGGEGGGTGGNTGSSIDDAKFDEKTNTLNIYTTKDGKTKVISVPITSLNNKVDDIVSLTLKQDNVLSLKCLNNGVEKEISENLDCLEDDILINEI